MESYAAAKKEGKRRGPKGRRGEKRRRGRRRKSKKGEEEEKEEKKIDLWHTWNHLSYMLLNEKARGTIVCIKKSPLILVLSFAISTPGRLLPQIFTGWLAPYHPDALSTQISTPHRLEACTGHSVSYHLCALSHTLSCFNFQASLIIGNYLTFCNVLIACSSQ